jgi:hypothetical protein
MKLAVRNHRRDLEVVFLRENKGWTYPQIGKKYDITKARARQLYLRVKQERAIEENKQVGIGA